MVIYMKGTLSTIARLYHLAISFPSLADLEVDRFFQFNSDTDEAIDFDAPAFDDWTKAARFGHGAYCAARFILSVWNPNTAKGDGFASEYFDVHEALGCWDAKHREAFAAWTAAPFWP